MAPKICDVIQKIDFVGSVDDDDQDSQLEEHFYTWRDSCTIADIKKAFQAFEAKVAVKNFPPESSPAYQLANSVLHFLKKLTEEVAPIEKEAQFREAGQIQLHLWAALLEAGPGQSHIRLMQGICYRDTKEYLTMMTPEEITSVFTMLKREFVNTGEDDDEEYCRILWHALIAVLDNFSKDQYRAVQTSALDLYIYYITQVPHLQPEFADFFVRLTKSLTHKFKDENNYLGLTSQDLLKKHLQILKDVMFLDQFHDEDGLTHDVTRNAFNNIFKAAMADNGKLAIEMFDFLMVLLQGFCDSERCIGHDTILYAYRIWLFRKLEVEPTDAMFDSALLTMMKLTEVQPMVTDIESLIRDVQEKFLFKKHTLSAEQVNQYLQWIMCLVKTGRKNLLNRAKSIIEHEPYVKGKYFKWKKNTKEALQIMDVIGTMKKPDYQDDKSEDLDRVVRAYRDFAKFILEQIKAERFIQDVGSTVMKCVLNCLQIDPPTKTQIAEELSDDDFLCMKKCRDEVPASLKAVCMLLKDADYVWDSDSSKVVPEVVDACIKAFDNGNQVTEECNALFIEIFHTCVSGEDEDRMFREDNPEMYSVFMLTSVRMIQYAQLYTPSKRVSVMNSLVPEIIKWMKISVETQFIANIMEASLQAICAGAPVEAGKFLGDIMDLFIEHFRTYGSLQALVHTLYPHNPEDVHKRLDDIFSKISELEEFSENGFLLILFNIGHHHPETFSEKQTTSLLEMCKTCDQSARTTLLTIILAISEKCPQKLVPHNSLLMNDTVFPEDTLNQRCRIISNVGHVSEIQPVISYLMKHANVRHSTTLQVVIGTLRSMVKAHAKLFERYKEKILSIEKTTSNPTIAESCHSMILVIEGKHVEELFDDLKEQQEGLILLDTRLVNTEDNVDVLEGEVKGQYEQISEVKSDVVKVGDKVDVVEKDLEETKVKVDEVDKKTMTSAPMWSRDVTKLMNPEAPNDWRLLASRLGYSNDDIRAWATQHDPCMALLSEWYATHKTSEASYGVLTALQEMNRQDAVIIMENAMKAAESTVEDEDFEYVSPPRIFISYQWGVQSEVKLLERHFNMAGYECWLDIGQMGGGDKLFSKIDNGIRAAKLIICCVTEKYAQSPNCNREVNLAVSLGKPIIPLLMEKMNWPPKGSMGPIFSEYLFVRFFQRGGEETKDQRYWPVPKFQEVLMQLNYNKLLPTEKLVTPEYEKWWIPVQEEIIIDKDKKNKQTQPVSQKQSDSENNTSGEVVSPDVFLSYQWGKQPQIISLYKRLTQLGYTCWMDIHQMGGGDSLYDKIDRGMRGCKVVVSCVTPKYGLSANCRREVSLADALKKPIIPLLLEQMQWPPDGPMSMVFTQLLFINFYRDPDNQLVWKGAKFDEAVSKINEHLGLQPQADSVTTAEKPTEGNAVKPKKQDDKAAKMEPSRVTFSGKEQSGTKEGQGQGNKADGEKTSKSCLIL